MNERNYKQDYETIRRHHESANMAIVVLQKDNIDLQNKLRSSQEVNASLEKQVNINKAIMHEALTAHNQETQDMGDEIQNLRAKIRELRGD